VTVAGVQPAAAGVVTVASAEAVRVRIPFAHAFATSAGTWHVRDAWIVRLRDTNGRVGVGEASLDPAAGTDDLASLDMAVGSAIPGLSARGAIDRWLTADHESTDAAHLALRAAIVGAALDLGVLPWAPTSAPAPSVRVNATIATEDPVATVGGARAAVAAGFTCLKVKGGSEGSTEALVERLAAVRAAVGPDIELRLDVNAAWDATVARERLAALAALDLAYVEQPIPVGDVPGLVGLRRGSPVRVAADESVASRPAARALLEAGAVDVLVIKPDRVGGGLEALAIAGGAAAAGVGVTISTPLATGVGLSAALRVAAALPGDREHAHGLATADVLVSDLLASPLVMTLGRISVPVAGIILDEAALERWTVKRVGSVA
jgi:o-succinylbenzoate synthase